MIADESSSFKCDGGDVGFRRQSSPDQDSRTARMEARPGDMHAVMGLPDREVIISKGERHPDLAYWAIMWEAKLYMKRKWVDYYMVKIVTDSRLMREEVFCAHIFDGRKYTEREVAI